jgi:hypothetical protein
MTAGSWLFVRGRSLVQHANDREVWVLSNADLEKLC